MSKKPHLIFLISNGFSARMICQTDLLQKLVEGGLRVGLLVPDCSDPSMTVLRDRWGVELHEYHAERNFFQVQVFQLRKYLLNDIRA
ncbi:MAG: hypothetical protein WBA17_06290, partial [Saprospiraceae bacterium]